MKSSLSIHRDLTLLGLLYSVAVTLVGSFTIYYLLSLGMPYYVAPLFVGIQMSTVFFFCLILGLTRIGKAGGNRLIALAMIPVFLLFLAVGFASPSNLQYTPIMIALLGGIALVLYWLPFNSYILHATHTGNRATITSYYSLLWPLVAIFIPVIGGWLIVRFSIWSNIAISSILLAGVASLALHTSHLPRLTGFNLKDWYAVNVFHPRLRLAFLLNGLIDGTVWVSTPLLGFVFADSAMRYGGYLAVFGIAGAIATLILSLFSDRTRKRKIYLYIGILILLPSGMLFFIQFNVEMYLLLLCLINFGSPMIGAFLFVIMGDSQRDIESAVLAREIYLNLGRLVAVMGILGLITMCDLRYALLPITLSSFILLVWK